MRRQILLAILAGSLLTAFLADEDKDNITVCETETISHLDIAEPIPLPVIEYTSGTIENTVDYIDEEIYSDSLEYVAMCVEAEAGNQGYLGKVYVTDCIFNRYDNGNYATFYDVINEAGQFECVDNGHIYCIPSEETYKVVQNEMQNRTNSKIIYFRTKQYSDYGTPAFRYKDHYFSEG